MNQELETLSLRILGALFNGGYQGLLLTLLVWSGLKLFPRTNAATRHVAWLATLLVVASLPIIHFLLTSTTPVHRDEASTLRRAASTKGLPVVTAPDAAVPTPRPASRRLPRTPVLQFPAGPTDMAQPNPVAAWTAGVSVVISETVPSDHARAGADLASSAQASSAGWWPAMRPWKAALPGKVAFGLVGLWALVATIRLGKLIAECRHLGLLKLRGIPAPEWLGASFTAMHREMRVRRETRLLTVQDSTAPMAVGYWKPAVLLPANLLPGSNPGGLDPIVRHELAHLRRGDDWSNLIQQVVRAMFFFHPGVCWLSKRLTLDREIACDDHVLAANATRKAYALLLTEFAGRTHYRNCSAAPAGWSRKSQLKERITMILDSKRNSSTQLSKPRAATFFAAATLLAAISLHAAPRLELALASSGRSGSESAGTIAASNSEASTGTTTAILSGGKAFLTTGSASSSPPIEPGTPGIAIVNHGPRPKPMPAPRAVIPVPVPPAATLPAHPPHAPVPPEPFHYEDVEVDLSDLDVDLADLDVKLADLHLELADLDPTRAAESGTSSRKERDGESMEERVERLEKLIESLMAGEGKTPDVEPGKRWNRDGKPGDDEFDMSFQWNSDLQGKLEKDLNWERMRGPEIEKITRQAQQEAQRAVREAQRMAEESRRASMDPNIRKEIYVRGPRAVQSREVQRRMLEAQRQALEMQMNHLEAQIERLEEERDSIEERVDEHEEMLENLDEEISAEEEREHEPTADEAVEDSGDKQAEKAADAPRPKKVL